MADLNEVRLIGRLTRDPVAKMIPSGIQVASFGFATTHRYKDQTGAMKEEPVFVDVTCWGKLAENICKYLKKGSQTFVGGRLCFESWDDKQTGQKRSKLTVVADNIQFLEAKRDNATQTEPPKSLESKPALISQTNEPPF